MSQERLSTYSAKKRIDMETIKSMKSILFYILAVFAGSTIFLGLPLLGWGITELPIFFDNPARLTYALVIFLLQIFSVVYNPKVGQKRDDRKIGVEQHKVDLVLIQIFSLSIVFLAPFSDSRSIAIFNFGDVVRFLGFVFIVPGFIYMQMAEKYLGKQFSIEVTIQKNHELIQDGPYKYIRHPRYLGILAFFTGISIIFRSLLSIFLVIALCSILIWRVYTEESLMHLEFGKKWEDYCRKSWRIIPFVF